MNILDPVVLRDTIMRERTAGVVTVDYRSAAPFFSGANKVDVDSYVTALGFSALGDGWRFTSRKEAHRILQQVLERDLAYDIPLIIAARADLLADSFLNLFLRNGSRYCSNGSLPPTSGGCGGLNPITNSTFDHGIVVHDDQHIGIVWVQDED